MMVLRSIFAVVIGLVVGSVVVFGVEMISQVLYPPPEGLVFTDSEAVSAWIATLPAGAMLILLAAWFIGTFVGAWLAVRIAGRAPMVFAMILAGVFLLGGVMNLSRIEHPSWMWAGLLVFPLAGILAAKLGSGRTVAKSN